MATIIQGLVSEITTGTGTGSITLSAAATAGNTIICGFNGYTTNSGMTVGAPTNSAGSGAGFNWNVDNTTAAPGGNHRFRAQSDSISNCAAAAHNAGFNWTNGFNGWMWIFEVSGLVTSVPFDAATSTLQQAVASGASPQIAGPITTLAGSNDFCYTPFCLIETTGSNPCGLAQGGAGWIAMPLTGLTSGLVQRTTGGFMALGMFYANQSNTNSSPTSSYSWTQTGTDDALAYLVAYQTVSGPTAPLPPFTQTQFFDNSSIVQT